MPIGVQVLAPAMAEPVMFRVAATLEANATGNLAPGERAASQGAAK
jgi:Asp-tRNA(Asn)/Glu-tRNA(Gln) amidotransferase A subunit family amidase